MTDFILVHGAWHGGWCWRQVADMLRDEGHRVFTPTLSGLGSRAHLLDAQTGLATHVADIIGLIDAEELGDTVLVGHSYGARPTALASIHPAVSRWISLDGVPIQPGDCIVPPGDTRTALEAQLIDGLAYPPMPPEIFGVPADHPAHGWIARRQTAMPWRCLIEPMPALPARFATLPRAYISAEANTLDGPIAAVQQARAAGFRIRSIASGHDLMVTAPEETAATLLSLAQ